MRADWFVVAASLSFAACATTPPPLVASNERVPAGATAPSIEAARPARPVFIEDNYPAALAKARAMGKPLFVDAWAPWCHTCLSMRAYVFPDETMRPLAAEFVWLALDTERPESAAFLEKYKMQVWPTLWVIDPKTETPALKWLGSATAKELSALLVDAKAAIANGNTQGEAGAALVRGHQASAAGRLEEAIREYKAALAAAPPHWSRRAPAVEALVAREDELKLDAECVETALAEMPKLPGGTSLANVAAEGLDCAHRSPNGSAGKKSEPVLLRAVEQIALDETVPILADDRSSLFETAIDVRRAAHDTEGVRAMAARWVDFLERQAHAARDPSERVVFDAHRMLAYFALGDPARALPMLADSERDFPTDYNPPARIAKVDLELKRYDEGLKEAGRALALVYGPRKLRVYLLEADLLAAKGDKNGALATLREAETYGAALPPPERPTHDLAEVERRIVSTKAE